MTHPWDMVVAAGVLVSLGFVLELGWPWLRAGLRKTRRETAEKEGFEQKETRSSAANANLAKPEMMSHGGKTVPSQLPRQALASGDNDGADSAALTRGCQANTEAQRLWDEARTMIHRFKPDWEKDQDYLAKVYGAAELGHVEAMAKLGAYAFRRGSLVEAFYWRWRAEANGWRGTEKPTLREIRSAWQLRECPTEYDNDLGEERGKFARAVLRLQCGIDAAGACRRLKRLADRGVPEAQLFLGKGTAPAK